DTVAHTITASVLNPYSGQNDILINFVDDGSVDQTIELGPGETREVALAIHAQDAKEGAYDLTATLVADGNGMHDNMTLHIVVLSEGNYTIEEVSFDEVTLARTYRITNSIYGKTITDLALEAVVPNTNTPAKVFIQPNLDHVRLEAGQSILITVYPVFTAEDAAQSVAANLQQNSDLASSNGDINVSLKTVQPSAVAPIDYELKASGSGVQKSTSGSVSCGGGKSIVPVVMQDCTMTFETRDWYCTNRPSINTPIVIPAFITPENITSASLDIVYSPQSNVQPHNGVVSFNGYQVGSYSGQVPTGQFSFNIPVSSFQSSVAGNALQTVQMNTTHPNPGHYVSATGYQLSIGISQAMTYVCADSQVSATHIVQSQYACSSVHVFNWLTDVWLNSILFSSLNSSAGASGSLGATEGACSVSTTNGCVGSGGDPINTKTGAFSTAISDLSFPTSAGELIFQRSYSSEATDLYTGVLGYGWTFNHASNLIFSTDPGGMDGFVLFQHPTGNQFLFKVEADGSYTPGPGVTASLDKTASSYVVTTSRQETFTFDLNGRLISRADDQGHAFDFDYDADGNLVKVSSDGGTRFIQITYDNSNRIISVDDHAGRQVTFSYDAAGDLVSTTNILGQTWTYEYDSEHRLTRINDPSGDQTLQTEYDIQGRAFKQYDGNRKPLVNIVYNADGTSTVYNALGQAETHEYDSRNTLTSTSTPSGESESKTYDENFRPDTITDANGATTDLMWSTDGRNLTQVTDAQGNQTDIAYDALSNPTSVVDPLGNSTSFSYNGLLLESTTDALSQTVNYTYTVGGDLASFTDALGHTTNYTYDTHGQRISQTDALGNTWTYAYDVLGRLIDETDPLGRVTHSEYDAAGRLIKQTSNYDPAKIQNE
ncbi:MAG: RHS repeat protein, partial [Chloroflexi bacterium]|nr:RHS repeat protein [Chloroflexota bacterium]